MTRALTNRQREVACLVAEGLPQKAIASTLGISRHTTEWHVDQIHRKLRLNSIALLTRYVIRQGWVAALFLAFACCAGQVQLAWDASPDAVTGYTVCYGPSDDLTVVSNLDVGNVVACTVSNLVLHQSYDFYVKAHVGTMTSEPSNTVADRPWLLVTATIEASDDLIRWAPLTNTTVRVTTQTPKKFHRAKMEER